MGVTQVRKAGGKRTGKKRRKFGGGGWDKGDFFSGS